MTKKKSYRNIKLITFSLAVRDDYQYKDLAIIMTNAANKFLTFNYKEGDDVGVIDYKCPPGLLPHPMDISDDAQKFCNMMRDKFAKETSEHDVNSDFIKRAQGYLADHILELAFRLGSSRERNEQRYEKAEIKQNPSRQVEELSAQMGLWLAKEIAEGRLALKTHILKGD